MSVINAMLRGLDQRAQRAGRESQLGDAVRATAPESAVTAKRVLLVVAAGLGGAALATGLWLYLQGILAPKAAAMPSAPPPALGAQPATIPASAPADAAVTAAVAMPKPGAADTVATAPVAAGPVVAGPVAAAPVAAAAVAEPAIQTASLMKSIKPVSPAPVVAGTASPAVAPTLSSEAPAAATAARPAGGKTYSPKQVAGNLMAEAAALDRQGRLDEAKQPLREVLVANPNDVAARQMLVQLQIDTGHLDEASALLEEGLQRQPGHPRLVWMLARMKAESGDVSGAITLLEGVRASVRDDPQLQAFLGALLLRSRRYPDAVQAYLAALRADPANPSWLLGAGAALEGVGNTADALEAYQRAEAVAGLTPEQAEFVSDRLTRLRR
jgi:MSHA biogenesis protein MshN